MDAVPFQLIEQMSFYSVLISMDETKSYAFQKSWVNNWIFMFGCTDSLMTDTHTNGSWTPY